MKQKFFSWLRRRSFGRRINHLRTFLASPERRTGVIPKNAKILVLAPHPDDESVGCGGTLSQLQIYGSTFDVAFLTEGSAGGVLAEPSTTDLISVRKKEAENATKILGVNRIYFFNQKDSQLHLEIKSTIQKLIKVIEENKYNYIFCPWIFDGHGDHEAAFKILAGALREKKEFAGRIWLYEIWNPLIPNIFIDITKSFPKKIKAIECYQSQLADTNFIEAFSSLAKYRSLMVPGSKYVEAFIEGDRNFILSMD